MKKRTLALMLSTALCVGLLAGCGSSSDTTNSPAADGNSPVADGNTPATEQAFKVVKFAGKVLLFAAGYPSPELNLNVNQVHYGNWHIIGTGGSDVADFQLACQYLNDGTVKVDKLLSQTLPLEEYQRAFELAATPGTYRVSISLWDE